MAFYSELGTLARTDSKYNINDEYDPSLKGKKGLRVFQQMRHEDPFLNGYFRMHMSIYKSANYFLDPALVPDEHKAEAARVAGLLNASLFKNNDFSFTDIISGIADNAATYGFSAYEIVLKKTNNFTEIKKLALRPALTVESFEIDKYGDLKGIYQRSPFGELVFIPVEKLLINSFDRSTGTPIGKSLLRGAYRAYYFASNIENMQSVLIEREAVGLPKITVPPHLFASEDEADVSLLRSIREQAEGMKVDERAFIMMPAARYSDPTNPGSVIETGYDFEVIRSGGSRAVNMQETIQYYRQAMLVSLLAEFLLLGAGGGSYSLAESKNGMFLLAIEGMLNQIIEQMNKKIIPLLIEINGIDPMYTPTIRFDNISRESLQTVANFLSQMSNSNLIDLNDKALRDHIRIIGGLPASDEEIESQAEAESPL